MNTVRPPVAILAGGGVLPQLVVQALRNQKIKNSDIYIISFEGQPQPKNLPDDLSITKLPLGQVEQIMSYLKEQGVRSAVLAGSLQRPKVLGLQLDATAQKLLRKAAQQSFRWPWQAKRWGHDDGILRAVAKLLAQQNIKLIPPHQLLPQVMAKKAIYSNRQPTTAERELAKQGFTALHTLGVLDVGQALVAHANSILGIEAAEGTQQLIERCAELRGTNAEGLLIKGPKPQQHQGLDVPTIGPDTLETLAKHHYSGVIVQAGGTQILDLEQCITIANKYNLLLMGL